jgi:predicted O-methyltransferase YrrM
MNGIVLKEVEQYLYNILPERDPVLQEMEQVAKERGIPIIGPAVGRLLFQLALTTQARRVFEMGSAIGYSTIWMARAVMDDGIVYYTDGNPDNARQAEIYFQRAGVAGRVKILVGNALDLIDQVEGPFDIIFNDVDKYQYPQVFYKAAARIRQGGLLISDNVLWSGRVAHQDTDDWTEAIRQHNRLIYEAPDFLTTILPLRDGVSVSLKLYK